MKKKSDFDDAYFAKYQDTNPRMSRIIENLDLSDVKRVLDFGCGPATLLEHLTGIDFYFGFDKSTDVINLSKAKTSSNIHFSHLETDFEKFTFDAVFLLDVINFMNDDALLDSLRKIRRSLDKKALLIIHQPRRESILFFYWWITYRSFHPVVRRDRDLIRLLHKAGFQLQAKYILEHYVPSLHRINYFSRLPVIGKYFKCRTLYIFTLHSFEL